MFDDLVLNIDSFESKYKSIDSLEFAKNKFRNMVLNYNDNKPKGQKKKPENILKDITNKVFIFDLPEKDAFVSALIKSDKSIESFVIKRMKTTKGSIYVIRAINGDYFCIHAHFFDRYLLRVKNDKIKTRREAIRHYVKSFTHELEHLFFQKNNSNEIMVQYKYGIGLGYLSSDKHLIFISTFVSNEMLRENQKEIINSYKR